MNIWNTNYNFMELGREPAIQPTTLALPILMKEILRSENEDYISRCFEQGYVEPTSIERIKEKMSQMGGKLVFKFISPGEDLSTLWKWNDGMAELSLSGAHVSVSAISKNEKFVREIVKFVRPLFTPPKKHGYVYAITSSGGRLMLSNIGSAGVPLITENYMPKVIEDYNYVLQDLKSAHPSGRIVVMEGEPGTGKTHLVRGMLLSVPDAMFVLVSPEMVSQLAGPELLPLLLANRHNTTGPIVLILEDADKCLVTRDDKNINSIQSLLNLGDGILGSMLDLRIIATTNAKKLEMEAAIMRPGRLSKMLRVGHLSQEVAQKVFRNLVSEETCPLMHPKLRELPFITLAEVYFFAREAGWSPEQRDKKTASAAGKTPEVLYDEKDSEDDNY